MYEVRRVVVVYQSSVQIMTSSFHLLRENIFCAPNVQPMHSIPLARAMIVDCSVKVERFVWVVDVVLLT